jgi:hypothetical protein
MEANVPEGSVSQVAFDDAPATISSHRILSTVCELTGEYACRGYAIHGYRLPLSYPESLQVIQIVAVLAKTVEVHLVAWSVLDRAPTAGANIEWAEALVASYDDLAFPAGLPSPSCAWGPMAVAADPPVLESGFLPSWPAQTSPVVLRLGPHRWRYSPEFKVRSIPSAVASCVAVAPDHL